MRKLFLYSLITSFTITGSVVGAGFITGKEVFEFFAKDFSISGLYLTFICFALTFYLVMINKGDGAFEQVVKKFVAFANLIVAGCMVSALKSVYQTLFPNIKNIRIFTIITTFLLFITSLKSIAFTERLSLFLLPIVIVVIVVTCVIKIQDYSLNVSPNGLDGAVNPIIYAGFNVVLSSEIIKNSGEKLSPPFKILSCVLTSAILSVCIFFLSMATKNLASGEMPYLNLFTKDKKLLKIVYIITLFAIYSTLSSAFYTSSRFCFSKDKISLKVLLFAVAILISEIGFSTIVERLYPALGVIGYCVVITSCLLSKSFPKEIRERTCHRQADIKRRCLP